MDKHQAAPNSEGTTMANPKGSGNTAPMVGDNGAAPSPDASNLNKIV